MRKKAELEGIWRKNRVSHKRKRSSQIFTSGVGSQEGSKTAVLSRSPHADPKNPACALLPVLNLCDCNLVRSNS